MLLDKNACQNNLDVIVRFCDGRQPWILWWKRIWKPTWPAGTFRNTSKRIPSLSTLNIFINDTFMAPTEKRRRKRLPGDKHCVTACFGVTGRFNTRNLPGIVKHDIEWLQRQLTAKTSLSWTLGRLTRNRKWISWSRLVKTWANKLTKAEACYLKTEIFRVCVPINDWKQGLGV